MKISKFLSVVLLAGATIITTSCNKDSDDKGNGGDAKEGTIQAKINGTAWENMVIGGHTTAVANYVGAAKTLTIQGSDADGKAVVLVLNAYDGSTGTWKMTSDSGASVLKCIGTYTEGSSNSWVAPYSGSGEVGEVKISEFSATGNVKGTFKFKAAKQEGGSHNASNTKNVTEGSFNIKVTSY